MVQEFINRVENGVDLSPGTFPSLAYASTYRFTCMFSASQLSVPELCPFLGLCIPGGQAQLRVAVSLAAAPLPCAL